MTSDERTQSRSVHGRVLMLAPNPDISGPVPGPIAKLAYALVDALREVGYTVDTELWGRHQREEGLLAKVAGRASDLMRIRKRIRQGSYDIVFIHTTHDSRALLRDLLLVAPGPAGVSWVLLIHGSHFAPDRPWFDRAARALVRRASAVLLLSSEEVAEWERFYPPARYRLVANAFTPASRGKTGGTAGTRKAAPPEMLFAGRLIREKGLFELIEAFADVRSRRECRLTVAGEGPELERLRARARELGVDGDVGFTGYVLEDELEAAYARACVFVLPSYSEGLPTVLLEAMGHGLPIVTTRIRGAADHLVEGVNALFVPPRDPAALAAALDRLLDDEGLRRAMGADNLRRVEEFAPSRVVEVYARVFDEVTGRKDQR